MPLSDTRFLHMAKLTELELKSLRPDSKGKTIYDDGNLRGTVRTLKDGKVSVSFVWRYVYEGKKKPLACGTWPNVPLSKIRKNRDEARQILEEGKDPAIERKTGKLEIMVSQQAAMAALEEQLALATVQDLFERWVKLELCQRKETSRAELTRSFKKDVLPVIGNIPAEKVTKAHVMKILDNILTRGARRLANRTLSELRQMFGFGYVRDIVKNDPTLRLKKSDIGGKETERDRVLSEEEIKELAKKVGETRLYLPTECAIWIMLSTGCRIGDLMKATWDEVDFEAKTWTFQPEKDQIHIERTHTVHLSDFSLKWFERLFELNGEFTWLFPNRNGNGSLCKKSVTKQIGDRQRTKALKNRSKHTGALRLSGGLWTPHDLRRTCSTLMVELGVPDKIANLCIYHLEPDRMKRIYIRAEMLEAMRDAWALLGERLSFLTSIDTDTEITHTAGTS